MTYERMAKRAGKLQWAGHQRPIGKRASRKTIRKLLRKRTETERDD